MTADLEALLTVQELDLAADQLRHRRETLPARAEMVSVRDRIRAVDAGLAATGSRQGDLAGRQDRLEGEIQDVRSKAESVNQKLYGGTVRNPRELMDLQEDLDALGRRQRVLEDQEIDVMEQLEPVESELESLERERIDLVADLDRHQDELAEVEAEIDGELAELAERRLAAIAPVAPPILDEYERLRTRFGGVGVARLVGSSCTGCHLSLPAVEVDRIRHGEMGPMVHCSECGRLLVVA